MARAFGWIVAASLLAFQPAANARGGHGGGHCSTGHGGSAHAGHSRGGGMSSWWNTASGSSSVSGGRVLPDGTYIESPQVRDCPPNQVCPKQTPAR
jgi:hypothetical protein